MCTKERAPATERTQRVLLEDDLGSEWLHRDAAMSLQLDDAMHIALFKIV